MIYNQRTNYAQVAPDSAIAYLFMTDFQRRAFVQRETMDLSRVSGVPDKHLFGYVNDAYAGAVACMTQAAQPDVDEDDLEHIENRYYEARGFTINLEWL